MDPHITDFKGQRVHMIGIGGSSMSGLAEMLKYEGYQVTGSDSNDSHAAQRLQLQGIPVSIGHHPEEIEGAHLVVYSAAIHEEDEERMEAKRLSIPQMDRAVLLGQLMEGYRETLCICGTHGKTTTTAMAAQMLLGMGMDPSVHMGGRLDAGQHSPALGFDCKPLHSDGGKGPAKVQNNPLVSIIGEQHVGPVAQGHIGNARLPRGMQRVHHILLLCYFNKKPGRSSHLDGGVLRQHFPLLDRKGGKGAGKPVVLAFFHALYASTPIG